MPRTIAFLVGVLGALAPLAARAGGLEIPDNGAEALGRGGAFVAKADDGTALQYNIAGLARQRGTRVTLGANLIFHDTAFTRTYPVNETGPNALWAGHRVTVHDQERFFAAPLFGISTDFGYFKRWTFGFGLYGPSAVGKHSYDFVGEDGKPFPTQVTLNNGGIAAGLVAPGPARYDIVKTDLLTIFPTLGVAVSPVRWLDVGLAVQLVYGHLNLSNANETIKGLTTMPEQGDHDAYGYISTSGITGAALASVMAHPTEWLDLGFTFRSPIELNTSGTLHAVPPASLNMAPFDAAATFTTRLPAWLRLGGRLVSRYADGTERADVELDLVWENWAWTGNPQLDVKEGVPIVDSLHVTVKHEYKDTFGVRLGGAYNFRLGDRTRIIARGGFYYDSAATENKHTRLDFDTHDKLGFTVGAGVKWRGVIFNIAYAYIYSLPRDVTDSEITAISTLFGTDYKASDYQSVIGNGRYVPSTQILSIGLTVNFNEFRRPTLMPN